MSTEPDISSVYLKLALDGLRALGLDIPSLLESAGIDAEKIADPDARIPRMCAQQVWLEASRRLCDPNMGMHIAEQLQPRAFNSAVYLAMSSRSLREGLARLIQYQRLIGTTSRQTLEDRNGDGFLLMDFGTDEVPRMRQQVEHLAVLWLTYSRWIVDDDFDFAEVHFEHPEPPDTSEHQRIFRCPIAFGAPVSGLLIASKDLDRPSIHADPKLARMHEEFAAESLRELSDGSFARVVEDSLIRCLEGGRLELRHAAERLSMSARTLQRRLSDEGTSYREVLDDLRRRITLRHLSRAAIPIDEIVYFAGFSDLSAFYRAFKRWTGRTPSEYRAHLVADPMSDPETATRWPDPRWRS